MRGSKKSKPSSKAPQPIQTQDDPNDKQLSKQEQNKILGEIIADIMGFNQ
jgi:hypothetical protein